MHTFKLTVLSIFVLLTTSAIPTAAAEYGVLSEGSLAISPFLIDATIKPGESQVQSITVSNITNVSLPITLSINDFVPSGEHGSVRFLENNEQSNSSFSLASWITITNQPEFIVPPKSETKVEFTITVPVNAEPGTHYGGLLFSARNKEAPTNGTTIIRKIGALILVSTGKTNSSGKIEQFKSDKPIYTKPEIYFTSIFANNGNNHLSPKGQIAIKNIFGKTVGESYLNENAQFVLPHTSRLFEGEFKKNWLFGRYKAELTYYFGNPKLEIRSSFSFWVFPIKKLGLFIGIISILGILLRLYNYWVVRHYKNK